MKHQMGLQTKYFNYIKNGTKRIELRLYDEKRRAIKIGDTIEFSESGNSGNKFQAEVIGLLRYATFEELLRDFDITMVAEAGMTKEEMREIMLEFYPIEKQRALGVIGIRIEPVR